MIPKTAEVVIVGGGVMGLSVAYHLARRGCTDVVVLERENNLGTQTTACCAGGIRHQFSTPINIQLSLLSIQMLETFEGVLGRALDIQWCGYTFILTQTDDIAAFQRAVELQHQLGVQTQWLSAADLRARLPMMCLDDVVAGTFYARDGLVDPSAIVNGYAAAARRLGVMLVTRVPVTNIVVKAGRVCQVVTPLGAIATHIVVNAAGPWAAALGQMVGVILPVKGVLQQLLVTTSLPEIPDDFPVVVFTTQGLGFHREGKGLLSGMTRPPQASDVASVLTSQWISVDRDWEAEHCGVAMKRLPCLQEAGIASHWAGLYEMTPDLHPILGACPPVEGFYTIAGYSGHGFMHAPISGLLLSEEILDGKAQTLNIAPLRLGRFQQSEALVERYTV